MIIEPLPLPPSPTDRHALVELLVACVNAGASMGFLAPLPGAEAAEYWEKIFAGAVAAQRVILVARETAGGPIIGSAQLAPELRANGRHRAEVQKVMVLPSYRRRGIAARLMAAIEAAAQARGTTLLFLDTSEGRGGAQEFYATLGYTYVGGIPGYAQDPDGALKKNAIYFKTLSGGS